MDEIRNRILSGANDLFMRYGVKSVTMDDIASQLSVSKKTIYSNFKDKDDLVNNVCFTHMESEKIEVAEIESSSANTVEELYKLTIYLRKMFQDMNPAVLFDIKKYHPQAFKIYEDHKEFCTKNVVAKNLKKGIEEGYFRENIDPDVLAIMRIHQMEWAFDRSYFSQLENYDFTHIQLQLFEHFVRGVMTPKGIELYNHYISENEK